ncbi:class I SAM-dependent methyltransferase [Flavisolibacter tropicus]|uniref:class I SAM-dependent methyltransferase n=1 Tax=Flavisolibacter tropicus TaxID=1492898 RepID=UPI0008357352|nr:class I SAM-dependent methyltransferase [Flavisolibacter tropicus]
MHRLINDTAPNYYDFEQEYLYLRDKEGRIYSDEVVAQLPLVSKSHHLKNEWKIRGRSCKWLVNYFSKKNKPYRILEIGCGNGWLSNQLANVQNVQVVGMDINTMELEQANRVFTRANLQFIYGDISNVCLNEQFDAIVFAAAFQYFESVGKILNACFGQLKEEGEVHIIDTPFYNVEECALAKERSKVYFNANSAPGMKAYYFHHSTASLEPYKYKILYSPKSFINKVFKINPFPWICISK